jgi:peptidyl-prolyl cis-trans isomerase D
MLNLMRKHAGSWMIKFILGAVILAFIPFGYGIYSDRRDAVVASVNGEAIRFDEYNQAYNNLLVQVRESFGNNLDEERIKALGLKRQALDQLIDRQLMMAEAKRLNLSVSDDELAASIKGIEGFQTAGVFDRRRYEYVLDRNHMTVEEFEALQKEALLVDKLRSFIVANARVSDLEARQWYDWNNAAIDIEFVAFSPNRYQGIEAPEQDLQQYYEQNKDAYRTEEKRKARYLYFNPATYKDRVTLTEAELRDYYDNNPEEFHSPKTVEARHVLIKVDPQADEATVAEARKKAEAVYEKAKSGMDFAQLAKTYSEGPTRDKGGFLGAFRKEAMVQPFADKAFSMQPGEISEPVRTRFGWHVIKVEKVNEETTTTFDAAKDGIRAKLIDEKARTLAFDEADAVYNATFEGDDLIKNAQERGLTISETDYFTSNGPVKGIRDRGFAEAAFKLAPMEISDLLDLADGFYILQVTDTVAPQIPEFQAVSSRVRADWIKAKQVERAKSEADALLAALQGGASLQEQSAKYGLTPDTTGFFARNAPIPKIGYNRELAEAAFGLTAEKPLPETVFPVNENYYLIRYHGRKEPSVEEFEKQKAATRERLLRQKQFQMLDDWVAELKRNSQINIEERFLQ